MTVAENMGFALKLAGTPKTAITQRVLEAARILDLQDYLDRRPERISGGLLMERSVRAVSVVVLEVFLQHHGEVARSGDQEVVEAFAA